MQHAAGTKGRRAIGRADSLSRSPLLLAFVLAAILLGRPGRAVAEPEPSVARLTREVRATGNGSFEEYLDRLPVHEGDERGYDEHRRAQPDLVRARRVIEEALVASLGRSNVTRQRFVADGYNGINIVGMLPGHGPHKERQYVLCAHYDSVQNPGADDDGSGVAGVLECARVLARHRFDATIVFLLVDQEEAEDRENGFARGSEHFAKAAQAEEADIRGVVVLDPIGYNHRGGNRATVSRVGRYARDDTGRLAAQVVAAFRDYTSLRVSTLPGEDSSDAVSFADAGFPVLLVTEQLDEDGWPINARYHEADDFHRTRSGARQRLEGRGYIDAPYAAQIVRAAVGWAATAAGLTRN